MVFAYPHSFYLAPLQGPSGVDGTLGLLLVRRTAHWPRAPLVSGRALQSTSPGIATSRLTRLTSLLLESSSSALVTFLARAL